MDLFECRMNPTVPIMTTFEKITKKLQTIRVLEILLNKNLKLQINFLSDLQIKILCGIVKKLPINQAASGE